mmetsp:Transcript_45449/g.95394  ORF Transcript_45449/g.95394 Transcript_45449/m.95394 type:complete len:313 (+) Transcript_45449:1459-2397(+)
MSIFFLVIINIIVLLLYLFPIRSNPNTHRIPLLLLVQIAIPHIPIHIGIHTTTHSLILTGIVRRSAHPTVLVGRDCNKNHHDDHPQSEPEESHAPRFAPITKLGSLCRAMMPIVAPVHEEGVPLVAVEVGLADAIPVRIVGVPTRTDVHVRIVRVGRNRRSGRRAFVFHTHTSSSYGTDRIIPHRGGGDASSSREVGCDFDGRDVAGMTRVVELIVASSAEEVAGGGRGWIVGRVHGRAFRGGVVGVGVDFHFAAIGGVGEGGVVGVGSFHVDVDVCDVYIGYWVDRLNEWANKMKKMLMMLIYVDDAMANR